MKTIFKKCTGFLLLLSFFLIFTSCKKEKLGVPTSFFASQGTYLGVVHLKWNTVPNAQYYNIDRQDPDTREWINAATTSNTEVDDYGFNLPDNKLVPGKHYSYRISAASSDISDGDYAFAPEEGWSYVPGQPAVTPEWQSDGSVLVAWRDTVAPDIFNGKVKNIKTVKYEVYRKKKEEPDLDYQKIYTSGSINVSDGVTPGDFDNLNYTDDSPGENPVYMVKAIYIFSYLNMDYGEMIRSADVSSNGFVPENGSGVAPADYSRLPLAALPSSSSGSIASMIMKKYNGEPWVGVIEEATVDYGVPAVYRFNGLAWEKKGDSYPPDIMNSTSLYQMDLVMTSQGLWMAGLDHDSLYVYFYNGSSWSDNRAARNLDASGSPSSLALTADGDGNVFLAVTEAPNYNLVVRQWNGNDWTTIGNDPLATGDIFSMELKNLGGKICVSYLVKNSDYNSTYHVLWLNNGQWTSIFNWTADNLMDVHLGGNGVGSYYFTAGSQKPDEWPGGVFKIYSATHPESLIPENAEWFVEPTALTVDEKGNLFIISTRFVSAGGIYPAVFAYDGTTWKIMPGNFTDGIRPAGVMAMGTDIYYVYGDAGDLAPDQQPKTLKAATFKKE